MDINRFVKEVVKDPWVARGDVIYLYHNEQNRLAIQPEKNLNHEGMWRDERLADHGICSADLDSDTLAKTFIEQVCQHLSINNMRHIRDHLTTAINAWEQSRHIPFTGG